MRALTIAFVGLLALASANSRAGVIGTVSGCIDNPLYTFCSSLFSAPVSGATWTFDVLFSSGSFIEALVTNDVEVNVFGNVDTAAVGISNFTVALLGLNGNPFNPPAFPSGDLGSSGEVTRVSSTDLVAGSKIGGLRATMNCAEKINGGNACDTGMTFTSLAITLKDVANMTEDDVTLRVGRVPPSTVPEPSTVALLGLSLFGLGWLRRQRA